MRVQRKGVQLTGNQQIGSTSITIINDSIREEDEQFSVEIVDIVFSERGMTHSLTDQERGRVSLQPGNSTVTIVDNDG